MINDGTKTTEALRLKAEHPDWGYQKIGNVAGLDRHKVRRAVEHAERQAGKSSALAESSNSGMSFLARYDAACRALAEAKRVDEVLAVRDEMEHLKLHGRLVKDRTLIAEATEVQLRAERRLGELLRAAEEAGLIKKGRPRTENPTNRKDFLAYGSPMPGSTTSFLQRRKRSLRCRPRHSRKCCGRLASVLLLGAPRLSIRQPC